MWFGRAFHRVAADVPFSYRIVLLLLGTSDVVNCRSESSRESLPCIEVVHKYMYTAENCYVLLLAIVYQLYLLTQVSSIDISSELSASLSVAASVCCDHVVVY